MIKEFRTHDGVIVQDDDFRRALEAVANDLQQLAHNIYRENKYAPHVTEEKKIELLNKALAHAESVRNGESFGFTVWQRINQKLTNKCVSFLPEETK